eukprot:scaffold20324_cov81-Isochrysis_galbana.AAC.2
MAEMVGIVCRASSASAWRGCDGVVDGGGLYEDHRRSSELGAPATAFPARRGKKNRQDVSKQNNTRSFP